MNMRNRVEALERALSVEDWPDMEIHFIEEDCSEAGRDKPGRLFMVTKSGKPGKPGRSYYRQETETEAAFLERVAGEEAGGKSGEHAKLRKSEI